MAESIIKGGPLSVNEGGTGAAIAADARTNLGVKRIKIATKSADNVEIEVDNTVEKTISVSESGWTAIGIIGINVDNASSSGSYYSRTAVTYYYLKTSSTAAVRIRNVYGTQQAKVKITLTILYEEA